MSPVQTRSEAAAGCLRRLRNRLGFLWQLPEASPIYWYSVLLIGSVGGLAHETALHQPSAYLDPIGGASRPWAAALALLGLGLGGWVAGKCAAPRQSLPKYALGASLLASFSGAAWFLALPTPLFFGVAAVIPGLGCTLALATLTLAWRQFGAEAVRRGVLEYTLSPFRLLFSMLLLGGAAALSAHLGLVRSGALIGLSLSVLALWSPILGSWLEGRRATKQLGFRILCSLGILTGLATFAAAEIALPRRALGIHAGEAVYATRTEVARYLIISVQDSFAVFRNEHLELSTTDDYRYYEALVHPALSAARRPQRVLLLGGGKGLAEQEILRWPEVKTLRVITEDKEFSRLAGRMAWWRERCGNAWADPRVELEEDEPLPWLREHPEKWDAILVDLPDPDEASTAKNYTRYFYSLLRQRLNPGAVAAIQGTSPFRSPQTFASIEQTVRAAGLDTLAYRSRIPTLGDWGFLLAAIHPVHPPSRFPPGLRFLDSETIAQLFARPRDLMSLQRPATNRLHDLVLVDILEHETPVD